MATPSTNPVRAMASHSVAPSGGPCMAQTPAKVRPSPRIRPRKKERPVDALPSFLAPSMMATAATSPARKPDAAKIGKLSDRSGLPAQKGDERAESHERDAPEQPDADRATEPSQPGLQSSHGNAVPLVRKSSSQWTIPEAGLTRCQGGRARRDEPSTVDPAPYGL